MIPQREPFPESEPATRPDFRVLPLSDEAARPPPPSTWRPRPPMKSATYSIVPDRESLDEAAARSEIATPLPPRPAPPSPAMAKSWRLRLLIGRIGRVTPAELLDVAEGADWATIRARYLALVREFQASAYESADGATRRRVAILLAGLAEAYEALAASHDRDASPSR
jgi:hypothetical protein